VVGLGLVLVTFVLFVRVKLPSVVDLCLELAKLVLVTQVEASFEVCHDPAWERRLSAQHHPFRQEWVACETYPFQQRRL
jgi:hypothetical protein